MPTGYTAALCEKEVSFENFALSCACAFFYDTSKLPKRWDVSSYYKDRLAEGLAELAKVEKMVIADVERAASKEFAKAEKEYEKVKRERVAAKDRLMAMRSKVVDWMPPTASHIELKKFMLQQLGETIRHDTGPIGDYAIPKHKTGADWLCDKLAGLRQDIAFLQKHYDEEVERANDRNEWCDALRSSFQQKVKE